MEDRKRPRHAPPASSAETGAGSGSGGRSVLVLGGNGMMGGDTVWELAQAGHTITTVNRVFLTWAFLILTGSPRGFADQCRHPHIVLGMHIFDRR